MESNFYTKDLLDAQREKNVRRSAIIAKIVTTNINKQKDKIYSDVGLQVIEDLAKEKLYPKSDYPYLYPPLVRDWAGLPLPLLEREKGTVPQCP